MTDTLRACPFCGSNSHNLLNFTDDIWRIQCWSCRAITREFEKKPQAIKAWNTRAECEKYEKILDLMKDGIRVLDSGLSIQADSALHHCMKGLFKELGEAE